MYQSQDYFIGAGKKKRKTKKQNLDNLSKKALNKHKKKLFLRKKYPHLYKDELPEVSSWTLSGSGDDLANFYRNTSGFVARKPYRDVPEAPQVRYMGYYDRIQPDFRSRMEGGYSFSDFGNDFIGFTKHIIAPVFSALPIPGASIVGKHIFGNIDKVAHALSPGYTYNEDGEEEPQPIEIHNDPTAPTYEITARKSGRQRPKGAGKKKNAKKSN